MALNMSSDFNLQKTECVQFWNPFNEDVYV